MRENRLSGSEGGATLVQSSPPLSISRSLRDMVVVPRPQEGNASRLCPICAFVPLCEICTSCHRLNPWSLVFVLFFSSPKCCTSIAS